MIINIRGTSGSGKTWVMRQVMEYFRGWRRFSAARRKQPLYYETFEQAQIQAVVCGHYEGTGCGGCDNIGSAKAVFNLVTTELADKPNILMEGLLLSEDVRWCSQLKHRDLRVIFLATDIEQCLTQVRSRRKAAGNENPLNEDNTRKRVVVIERARLKLLQAGVVCRRASANQAPGIIIEWLKNG